MPLNREEFQRLEERIVETLEGREMWMQVPYYVCLYSPKDELEVLECFPNVVLRLKNKGFSAETIKLNELMLEILSDSGYLKPEVIEKEEEMREDLELDLRHELLDKTVERLEKRLEEKDRSHCAVLLRYGALRPFVHISHVFSYIMGSVQCTLLVPYPSDKGTGYPLNQPSEGIAEYYRAEVVDLR